MLQYLPYFISFSCVIFRCSSACFVFASVSSAAIIKMFAKSFLLALLLLIGFAHGAQLPISIGSLTPLDHDVTSGPVYIVSPTQIRITKLTYDGQGPDAFFWVGKSHNGKPNPSGVIVPYKGSSTRPIPGFAGDTVDLTLPKGLTVNDINYISLWCRAYTVDFGHVTIPANLNITTPAAADSAKKQVSTAAIRFPSSTKSSQNVFGSSLGGGNQQQLRPPISSPNSFGSRPAISQPNFANRVPIAPAHF